MGWEERLYEKKFVQRSIASGVLRFLQEKGYLNEEGEKRYLEQEEKLLSDILRHLDETSEKV